MRLRVEPRRCAHRPRRLVGSGITAAEQRHLEDWADGPRLFEHVARLPGALSFEDVPEYLRRHGFGAGVLPYGTARGTRIDCRGVRVGYLFVIDKEGGGEFTAGDEEVLPLFASQRGDGDRQRARPPGRTAGAGQAGGHWSTLFPSALWSCGRDTPG